MSIALVGFALLMVLPALLARDTWARVPLGTSCRACRWPSEP